jgi:hypothetical protein
MQGQSYPQAVRTAEQSSGRPGEASSSKVTRYDIINKNYILPQESYPHESSYTGSYKNNAGSRVRTEKVAHVQNEILPKGKFEGDSSYLLDYINVPGSRGEAFRPEGELKVGGKFEGQSKYAYDYYDKGTLGRQEKSRLPQNQVMPEGKFEGGSTYVGNYLSNPLQRVQQIKPEGELKVGKGPFQGQSSYGADYEGQQQPEKSERVHYPANYVLPRGRFEGSSTYGGNYQGQPEEYHHTAVKPEGELKVGGGVFEGQSNYSSEFGKKEGARSDRVPLPQNEVMPKGNFVSGSIYGEAYLETHPEPRGQFRPEGELKVGGNHFDGSSSYLRDFEGKTAPRRERVTYKDNEVLPPGGF